MAARRIACHVLINYGDVIVLLLFYILELYRSSVGLWTSLLVSFFFLFHILCISLPSLHPIHPLVHFKYTHPCFFLSRVYNNTLSRLIFVGGVLALLSFKVSPPPPLFRARWWGLVGVREDSLLDIDWFKTWQCNC